MLLEARKATGSYYTPSAVAASLVSWAVRRPTDRMLDPSCGDGRFLAFHQNSVGIERSAAAARVARESAPGAQVHRDDFFRWAIHTSERFDAAAGNPPFIRYQRFSGEARAPALFLCSRLGANFSSLTSSWAPFLVAAASLLNNGGRLAFVVPAEIGHAPYAVPLLEYLAANFKFVQIIAVRNKLFENLSEDCWLLYADGFGGSTDRFRFSPQAEFDPQNGRPTDGIDVTVRSWKQWNHRLRPFLMPRTAREVYREIAGGTSSVRLGDVARVGIGYVTGANEFFHLRPSVASKFGIPDDFLRPSVRKGSVLEGDSVTLTTVKRWLLADDPVLLLWLQKGQELPESVQRYLRTEDAREARGAYKCRTRNPWYVVPDVTVPDAFLSYMSGEGASLVANRAKCVCTNSVHAVHVTGKMSIGEVQRRWRDPIAQLSCEIEGHPLGGGVLKIEPREATRLVLADRKPSVVEDIAIRAGIAELRKWRHYGEIKEEQASERPAWISLADALSTFARCQHKPQSQRHIQPLHSYTACRLVIEGGFRPEAVIPRPPFRVRKSGEGFVLEHEPSAAVAGEHTLFGGLKTKDVDVVVSHPGIGPVIAVSMKGTLNAFRNLTNRMEEAAGDCTNIHLAYPGLVYAFWHIFRANVEGTAPSDTPDIFKLEGGRFTAPDVAIQRDGSLSNDLARYLFAMDRLSGRKDMRDDPSSYEAVGITLVNVADVCSGKIVRDHPPPDSPLRHDQMFKKIYEQYDLRFVYQSPALKAVTRRLTWAEESPALSALPGMDFQPRIGLADSDQDEANAMENETEE